MLKSGLTHGVAVIPNAPKQRYTDPLTGAHFDFEDMCQRIDRIQKARFVEDLAAQKKKGIQKDFMKESRNGTDLQTK